MDRIRNDRLHCQHPQIFAFALMWKVMMITIPTSVPREEEEEEELIGVEVAVDMAAIASP